MPLRITSPHNPRVKAAAQLREHRERAARGETLIDGVREIARAVTSGMGVRELFLAEKAADQEAALALIAEVMTRGGECFVLTQGVYEKLAYGERHDGAVAVVETPSRKLTDLVLPADRPPLVAVVEGLEKPGNLGAVLRSADAVGLDALIVCDGGTDLYNPNVIRASLGTIFTMPLAQAGSIETLAWLRERGLQITTANVGADRLYTDADFTIPTAIILGSEAEGLTPIWQSADILPIALPMLGIADSLNVSVTAAVLFYEAWRQRRAS